jgi:phage baseplate assembly protein W
MATPIKQFSDKWAYDIAKDIYKNGEVNDSDVINQSIELILGTAYGERFFNSSFGSSLPNRLFDSMDINYGERILDDIVVAINRWEDRITILENEMRMVISNNQNSVKITIPYIVKRNGQVGYFKKKIII